jgi:hypothetical protein
MGGSSGSRQEPALHPGQAVKDDSGHLFLIPAFQIGKKHGSLQTTFTSESMFTSSLMAGFTTARRRLPAHSPIIEPGCENDRGERFSRAAFPAAWAACPARTASWTAGLVRCGRKIRPSAGTEESRPILMSAATQLGRVCKASLVEEAV